VQAREVLHSQFQQDVALLNKLGAKRGRLLELGCAYGFFLDQAKDYYEVSGVELCEAAVQACKARGHLDVYHGQVSKESLARFEKVDVVVMLDVIEHLADPLEALEAAADKLNVGGLLLLTTGDFASLLARVAGSRWRLMTPPQHLWFFTPRSFEVLSSRLHMEVIYLDHPWKRVPFGLIIYQLCRFLSIQPTLPAWVHRFGIPVNLFDAMRIVFRKRGQG
jgi:SAM-dependent methyltransferase